MDESPPGAGRIGVIVKELEAQLPRIQALYNRPDSVLSHHSSPDAWCAKQVLGHLIEADGEVFGALIPGMLGRKAPDNWDQVPGMVRTECDGDTSKLLARFTELRTNGIAIARTLSEEDLTATSPKNWHGGEVESVGDLLRHWPRHTENHENQAKLAIQEAEAVSD